jgi:hypothetical protein
VTTQTINDLKKSFYKSYFGYTEAQMASKSMMDLEREFFESAGFAFSRNTIRRVAGAYKNFPTRVPFGTSLDADGVLKAYPVDIPEDITIDRIGVEVSTAGVQGGGGAPVVRIGIYNDNGTGKAPGTLLLDAGTVDSSTTGLKEKVISQALPKGRYWFAVVPQGAPATSTTLRASVSGNDLETPTNPTTFTQAAYQAQAPCAGALPSPFGTINTGGSGSAARVFVKIV